MAEDSEKFKPNAEMYASFIGLKGEYDTEEDFKQDFESIYIRRDNVKDDNDLVSTLTGKSFGTIDSIVYSKAKENGFEFTPDDKKLRTSEKVELALSKVSDYYKNQLEEAKQNKGKSSDALAQEWEAKLKAKDDRISEVEGLLSENVSKYKEFVSNQENENKNRVKSSAWEDGFSKLSIAKEKDELSREGFRSILSKNYIVDLDDDLKPFITDKDGNKIKHDKVADSFMTIDEVFKKEAIKNNMLSVNPHEDQSPQVVRTVTQTTQDANPNRPPVARRAIQQ